MKHEKHPKLERARIQTFAWNEVGFFGETCANIRSFCGELSSKLLQFSCVYIDADHTALDNPGTINRSHSTFKAEIIDQQGQFSLFSADRPDGFALTGLADRFDLALVNANHFTPSATVLLWNNNRIASILKRKEQLALCVAVVGIARNDMPAEVLEILPKDVVFLENSTTILDQFLSGNFSLPPIHALVLAGGKSSRMGRDKAMMAFHEEPQYQHLLKLLNNHTTECHLSVSSLDHYPEIVLRLPDRFVGLGPFGALLTAFAHNPNVAWLVVACDLPLVDADFIEELLAKRDPSKIATAFLNPETGFPDPLCTLWEPKSYSRMLSFLARGYSCPRKVLINSDIALIETATPEKLKNINTPEEFEALKALIKDQARN